MAQRLLWSRAAIGLLEDKKEISMKTGLILEGGAMRGMFTAGVLDVLMEHGITVDGAIGVVGWGGVWLQLQIPAGRPHDPL